MKIDAEDLYAAIKRVRRAVNTKHNVDLLRNFCFHDKELVGYNQNIGVSTRVDLSLDCCVPADRLDNLVRNMRGEINITERSDRLIFKNNNFQASVKKIASHGFPNFIPVSIDLIIQHPSGLVNALLAALPCATEKIIPPQLHGIAVQNKYVYAAAQAGASFTKIELAEEIPRKLIFPRYAARQLANFGEPDEVYSNEAVVVFVYKDIETKVVCSQWAHEFPSGAIDSLVDEPVNSAHTVSLPDGMSKLLERVCSVSPGNIDTKTVWLAAKDRQLVISCSDDLASESSEAIPWDKPFDFNVKMRAGYLMSALRVSRMANFTNILSDNPRFIRFWNGIQTQLVGLVA